MVGDVVVPLWRGSTVSAMHGWEYSLTFLATHGRIKPCCELFRPCAPKTIRAGAGDVGHFADRAWGWEWVTPSIVYSFGSVCEIACKYSTSFKMRRTERGRWRFLELLCVKLPKPAEVT